MYWVGLLFGLGAIWTWANRLPVVSATEAAQVAAPHTNFAAPRFALSSTEGETFDLSALKGQVIIVNFWATWCPPCRAEMPALDEVYRAEKAAGLLVLAVDKQEDLPTVKAFGEQLNLSFPLLLDRDGQTSIRYDIRALPTSFFIDRQGVIREVVIGGPMTRELIAGKVNGLLASGLP